jgi:hypothetical protein
MRKILILITIALTISSSAQDSIPDTTYHSSDKNLLEEIGSDSAVVKNTSKNLNHSGEIRIQSSSKSILEFIFPSLIALIVGMMAYWATIRTSKHQRNIIKKQMEANKLAVAEQIESSLKIAELDFRKTVLSTNRQVWINDLRVVISELVSLVNACSVSSDDIRNDDYRKISFLITKAEFMLNPTKDKDYIESIVKLQDSLFQLSVRKKKYSDVMKDIESVKQHTKSTLKNEWERVKRGE